jgi:ribosome assembly protein YihI (activator of Der GTPase)
MAQRKETKKTIKVRDLKPKKDAKGGAVGRDQSFGHNQNQVRNQNQGRNPTIVGG